MTKLEKAYNAKRDEAATVAYGAIGAGWSEDMFARERALRAEAEVIYDQMLALREAAKALGWYVTNWTLRYNESTHRELVAANCD